MMDLWSQLQASAESRPAEIALRKVGMEGCAITTYAQLCSDARRFGEIFQRCEDATIVPILLPKSAECIAAMFGAMAAGKAFACRDASSTAAS